MVMLLSGNDLTLDQLLAVSRFGAYVDLTEDARSRMRTARKVVEDVLAKGIPIYGGNTDVGPLNKRRVADQEIEEFQLRMIVGHSVAFSSELESAVVRAMMTARVNGFAKGGAGVRVEVAEKMMELLNKRVHPIVVCGSSIGQADLSEMAQIALVLVGMGTAEYRGEHLPGAEALAAAGISPLKLAAKEGLALISSNGLTLGRGALVLEEARRTLYAFDLAAALALEAFRGNVSIINEVAARLKPHPGLRRVSLRMQNLLFGSYLWEPGAARNMQDPLSFRCVAQVHGALDEAVTRLTETLEIELNSAGDNPLVSIEDGTVVSVGNFDITNLAISFDKLKIALTHAINLSDQRIQKQLWAEFSELPTGLERGNDPLSRLIPLARTSAALTAEAQSLSAPVSVSYRAQVAEGIEDHASAGPLAVQQTENLVRVAQRIIALEMLVCAAAIELRSPPTLGLGTRRAYDYIREGPWSSAPDWMSAIQRILSGIKNGDLTNVSDPQSLAARFAADPDNVIETKFGPKEPIKGEAE